MTFPLSLPGVGAGALLCFIPIVGEFVIPGSAGRLQFDDDRPDAVAGILHQPDWPVASAAAVALLILLVPPLLLYDRLQRRQLEGGR